MGDWLQIKNNLQSELASISALLEDVSISEQATVFEINSKDLFSSDTKNSELKEKVNAHFGFFKGEVIYTFALQGCEDYTAINTAFLEAKTTKRGKRAYSKHNNIRNGLLYVGSSQSIYLVARIKNHLGIGSRTVYSMHIREWLPRDLKCNIVINVSQVNIPNNNIKLVKMLELVEQGLWDANKPLFGKRSGLL